MPWVLDSRRGAKWLRDPGKSLGLPGLLPWLQMGSVVAFAPQGCRCEGSSELCVLSAWHTGLCGAQLGRPLSDSCGVCTCPWLDGASALGASEPPTQSRTCSFHGGRLGVPQAVLEGQSHSTPLSVWGFPHGQGAGPGQGQGLVKIRGAPRVVRAPALGTFCRSSSLRGGRELSGRGL